MNTEDLEKGLETCRTTAELFGFTTISNTDRTVTLSPEDKSALKGRGRLIFDLSIMDTKKVQHFSHSTEGVKKATKASELIMEEFCLMITLNDERNSAIYLYGVTTGLGVFKRFGEWVTNVLDHKIEMSKELEVELTRTLRNGIVRSLANGGRLEKVARFLGRTPSDVVRQYDTRSDDSGTTPGQTAFSE